MEITVAIYSSRIWKNTMGYAGAESNEQVAPFDQEEHLP
jgi:hypothetical protein